MSETQKQKIIERIVYRFDIGFSFIEALDDVLHWFGKLPKADRVFITVEAWKKTIANLP